MRLPVFGATLVATAIVGMSSVYGQCPGGNCPYPQSRPQNVYQDPHWQGNQNPNWQGNQSPNYRNDGGWNNQASSQVNSYYSRESTGPYTNPSNMFDSNDDKSNSNNATNAYFSNTPKVEGQNQAQGYFFGGADKSKDSSGEIKNDGGPDSLVQHRVDESLKNNYLKKNYPNVAARAYNGTVTLSGSVETEQDRQDVEARVRDIPGVRSLNDQIKISGTTQTSANDDRARRFTADASTTTRSTESLTGDQDLQKQVDESLKNNYVKKNYDTVVATVTHGVVTVSGTVKSDSDRQEIIDRLNKIKGVSKVNDRIQVSASAAK